MENLATNSDAMTAENKVKPKKIKYKKDALLFNLACLIVPVVQWLIFWLYVNAQSITLAFKNPLTGEWDFSINYKWIWMLQLKIERTSLKFNGSLLMAFENTMKFFALGIFVTLPLCLFISYFIYKKIYGYKFFRIIFYLPAVIPAVVLTTVFKESVLPSGIINSIFHNIPETGLLFNQKTALGATMVYSLLTGFTTNVLLFSGGMSRIPEEVMEAAKLDGVGPFREVISLIIPLIWPTLTTQIVLAFTSMFTTGAPVMLLNKGQHGTMTISYWLFYAIAGDGVGGINDAGAYRVSAVGLALTVVAVPIILGIRKLFSRVEDIEY